MQIGGYKVGKWFVPGWVFFPAVEIGAWTWMFAGPKQPSVSAPIFAVITLFLVIQLIRAVRYRLAVWWLILVAFVTVSMFVGQYGQLYWSHGSPRNFSQPLTRLDALYFAVGTLSTAGTGNINAISESARTIQLTEMLIGMAIALVGISAVVSAIVSAPPLSFERKVVVTRRNEQTTTPRRKRKRRQAGFGSSKS